MAPQSLNTHSFWNSMQVLNNARSGLWVGQALETKENVPTGASRELRWVLSVTATAPSAFGGEAVLGEDGPNGCRPLTGDWDRGANQLRLRRLGGPDETVYTGRLKFDPVDSSWGITGTWLAAGGGGGRTAWRGGALRRAPGAEAARADLGAQTFKRTAARLRAGLFLKLTVCPLSQIWPIQVTSRFQSSCFAHERPRSEYAEPQRRSIQYPLATIRTAMAERPR